MMKPAVLTALNAQIQHELSSAYAYQAVALYFGHLNLHGFEAFMTRQATEERKHAHRFIRHVADRGGQADLGALPAPKGSFATALEAVRAVRDLERTTTEKIHRLYDLARRENDCALEILLHWYIAEQVEEEQWSSELAALTEQFQEHPEQLFMLDDRWGERVLEQAQGQRP